MDHEKTASVIEAVRARMWSFPCSHSPVEIAAEIHELVSTTANDGDPYGATKKQSNRACRLSMTVLSEHLDRSVNPFETAVILAIAGNVIDFGVFGPASLSRRDIIRSVQSIIREPLVGESTADLKGLIDRAERILYIGDNAGECFLDTFLLAQMPAGKVTYAVRGGPVLNDATVQDAEAAGIHRLCRIVDTGDNAPGVLLERCSAEFRETFDEADLVIAKGHGNYESLNETPGKTCAFLTKVKCPVIARDIGYPVGSNVILIINSELQYSDMPRLGRNDDT